MDKTRLLKLADLLEADAANEKGIKFDLGFVGRKVLDNGDLAGFENLNEVTVDCGTAACAVGLACISKAFADEGLNYQLSWNGDIAPVYRKVIGWGAEEAFFGLTEDESEFLFQSHKYPKGMTRGSKGERCVAKRIRDFVAGKVSPPARAA